ncbi:MAG: nitroreductase family protein [Hyphomonadaceae bacterium]|nr:nitroreductase family protein [Hyphomonadaceae bacterium]
MTSAADVRTAAGASFSSKLDVIEAILRRRSVPPRHLLTPGPTEGEVAVMIDAAASAPDHGGLKPFRFIQVMSRGRPVLADAFVAAEQDSNPFASHDDLLRARERAMHAPTLFALVTRLTFDVPDVPSPEQLATAGAALGYFLLAAHALGFGAMAVSGAKARSQIVHTALRLGTDEQLLCFVGVGTPVKQRTPRSFASRHLLTRWDGA